MSAAKVIIIREPLAQSIAKDAVTFGCLNAVCAIGIYVDSQALQWVGAVLWMLWVLTRAFDLRKTYSVPEARKLLDEIEGLAAPPNTNSD